MHRGHSHPSFRTRRRLLGSLGAGGAAIAMGFAAPVAAADSDAACPGGALPPHLVGRFVDGYGHRHAIDATTWQSVHDDEGFLYHICSVSPQDGFLIARNDASQAYHPGKFSRFEWIVNDDGVWYCQQVFAAGSRGEAGDFDRFPAGRHQDPSLAGCGDTGGFAWTNLTPQ